MIYFILAIIISFIITAILYRKNIYSIVPSVALVIFFEILMFYISYLNTYIDSTLINCLAKLNEFIFIILLPANSAIILFVFAFAVLAGEKFDIRHKLALLFAIIIVLAIITRIILYTCDFSNILRIICNLICYISDFMMIMAISYFIATNRYRKYRNRETENRYDCIIVLGYRVDGDETSKVLMDRIEMAFGYFNRHGKNIPIYLCGGKCYANKLPEADVMEKEFLKLGVPQEYLHKESSSSNTKENFRFINHSLIESGINNPHCLVVTNYFHMFRAVILARETGLNAEVIGNRNNSFDKLYIQLMSREMMAFIFNNPYLFIIYTETLFLILSFAYITFKI